VFAERLGTKLASAAGQTLSVVEPRQRVQQAFRTGAVCVEFGADVRPDLEQDFVCFVRRGDAFPCTGPERRGPLIARGVLTEGEQQRRATRDPRIGTQEPAQLDPRHVGQLGVYDDDVGLGAAGALQRVPARGLAQHGVPRRLEQIPQPVGVVRVITCEQHQGQACPWRLVTHAVPPHRFA